MATKLLSANGNNVFVSDTDWELVLTLNNDGALTTDTLAGGTFLTAFRREGGGSVHEGIGSPAIDDVAKTLTFQVAASVNANWPPGRVLADVLGVLVGGTKRIWGPYEFVVRRPITEQ
jgi:hypothetical protein